MNKREQVLEALSVKAKAFNIKIDYVVEEEREYLVCDGQKISTTANSILAIQDELIGFIFIKNYSRTRVTKRIGNDIKQYWMN